MVEATRIRSTRRRDTGSLLGRRIRLLGVRPRDLLGVQRCALLPRGRESEGERERKGTRREALKKCDREIERKWERRRKWGVCVYI